MNKDELRKQYSQKRKELTPEEISAYSDAIFHQLSKINIWESNNYMTYYPIENKNEVNTQELISELWKQKKKVFLPKIEGEEMVAISYTPNSILEKNNLNIEEPLNGTLIEPNKIEVFFIPMLICDQYGNRVGYGKGYYDKYLHRASTQALKIGLNFFPPIQEKIENATHDIPLDYCVTPNEVLSFTPKS